MANDYKPDEGKPPVMDAVFIPYRRSLLAIAAMKADMAIKHKLLGAVDPFLEWMQLPNAKRRLANAGARHALQPWNVNVKDGSHLHITHAIVGLLMALELHLKEEEENVTNVLAQDAMRKKVAAPLYVCDACAAVAQSSAAMRTCGWPACANYQPPEHPVRLTHAAVALPTDQCICGHSRCMHMVSEPVHVCSGVRRTQLQGRAEVKKSTCLCREFRFDSPVGRFWTGDSGTWHCTCGAGRPSACTCDQSQGENL